MLGTGPAAAEDELEADLRSFHADEETIAQWCGTQAARQAEIEILPEIWPAVGLFAASATQWRRAGMSGIPTGLDYAGVAIVARAQGVALEDALFEDLQLMEAAALEAWAEARS